MKRQVATNCSEILFNAIKNFSDEIGLSRNAYMETTAILECLKENRYDFTNDEINELWNDYPSKSNCKITKEFLELQKKLPKSVKCEVIKFFYNINLINNIRFSALKQANFYVKRYNQDDEFLFYYGINNMKNYKIQYYVENLGISIKSYGIKCENSDEYIYLGRMQQYKHSSKCSNLFFKVCEELHLEPCDCIKVHYKSLDKIIDILKLF